MLVIPSISGTIFFLDIYERTGISDFRFGLKSGNISPNGTNLGLFKISFLFILAQRAKMNRKLILKAHSESKPDIPGLQNVCCM